MEKNSLWLLNSLKKQLFNSFLNNNRINKLKRNEITKILNIYEKLHTNSINNKDNYESNCFDTSDFKNMDQDTKYIIEKTEESLTQLKKLSGNDLLQEINWLKKDLDTNFELTDQTETFVLNPTTEYLNLFNSDSYLEEHNKDNNIEISKPDFSINMGLFYIDYNNNNSFPIHDHPGMVVFSKCLYGEIKVLSFTEVKNTSKEPNEKNGHGSSNDKNNKSNKNNNNKKPKISVQLTEQKTLNKDDWTILYPRKNNFHLIIANEPSVLFDFFLPYYDENNKCNYYNSLHKKKLLFDLYKST